MKVKILTQQGNCGSWALNKQTNKISKNARFPFKSCVLFFRLDVSHAKNSFFFF